MKVTKVVRRSDIGPDYDNRNRAYRTPGVLVFDNKMIRIFEDSKPPYFAGGYFGYAASIAEAIGMVRDKDDRHERAIRALMQLAAEYGYFLSYRKALKEYAEYTGVFRWIHPTDLERDLKTVRRVLRAMLHREVWFQHEKELPKGSEERHWAGEYSYSWSGVIASMTFGYVVGVDRRVAGFLEKLPRLREYDFSVDNPLFEEGGKGKIVAI